MRRFKLGKEMRREVRWSCEWKVKDTREALNARHRHASTSSAAVRHKRASEPTPSGLNLNRGVTHAGRWSQDCRRSCRSKLKGDFQPAPLYASQSFIQQQLPLLYSDSGQGEKHDGISACPSLSDYLGHGALTFAQWAPIRALWINEDTLNPKQLGEHCSRGLLAKTLLNDKVTHFPHIWFTLSTVEDPL